MITYAIGDVHGRDDLLEQMHERIAADRRDRYPNAKATIVHVGDYVDRGPESLAVIDRLIKGVAGFETICLKGNHEAMMIACAGSDDRQLWSNWRANGGDATLRSLGLTGLFNRCDSGHLMEKLGAARLAWLRSLPLTHHSAAALFVHAGIVPGRPMELQSEHDLLWIRDGFLDSDHDHGFLVVHGHTPMATPDVQPNRLGIDTGAVYTGRLTAAVLGETDRVRFLVATA